MTGLRLALETTFTDPTLPKFVEDPVITAGSLWLFDVRASLAGIGAGAPTPLDHVGNLAWRELAAARGGALDEELYGTVIERLDGDGMQLERSGKGGIHGIFRRDGAGIGAGVGFGLNAPLRAREHIIQYPGHSYYLGFWQRPTRKPNAPGGAAPNGAQQTYQLAKRSYGAGYMGIAYNGAADVTASWFPSNAGRTGLPDLLNVGSLQATAVGQFDRVAMAVSAKASSPYYGTFSGGVPTDPASAAEIFVGAMMGRIIGSSQHGSGSRIIYRAYLEDLTISGRSASQVDAIEADAAIKAAGAGGAFNGDTYTNPNTVYPLA